MKTAIVTTTINVPRLFTAYAADAIAHGHKQTKFYVVGDHKTPVETEPYCRQLAEEFGLPVCWLGVKEQKEFLLQYPELNAQLPWNAVQRRNIGHLLAWLEGYDVIVAVDDDNFLADEDYIGHHVTALSTRETEAVASDDGWFNCCTMLKEAQDRYFFPRGYPVTKRRGPHGALKRSVSKSRVVVSAGLWLGDPDVDAVTRLAAPVEATACRHASRVALTKGTWCPFNSQNTAVHRDVLPAWFLSPYAQRFDDIWSSYIVMACAESFGHTVAFGHPLVRQDRNAHDLWRDCDLERMGLKHTEGFCHTLQQAGIKGPDYGACAGQAVTAIARWAAGEKTLAPEHKKLIDGIVTGYQVWIEMFGRLSAQQADAQRRSAS